MKKSYVFVIVLALMVVLAGCAPETAPVATEASVAEEAPVKEVTIGFIPMTLDNEYFITMVNAAQQEADKSGVKLLVQAGTSHGSAEEQLQIVETMITNKVDAICIVPSSSVGLMTALKKAEEAGIPVVNLDTGLDPDLVESSGLKPVPFIGTNNYDGAKLAGEYALEITGGTGEVAILTGIAGQQNAADRRNGFFDAVEGKLEVVAEASADWEVEKGYNAAQNIIQANPDIVLIFASNDNMALGAIRAAKEAGKDIKVIGYDAIGEALNSVKSGDMASTIAQFPAEMGIQGVQAALNLLGGGTMPDFTFTETRPITSTNVDEFMTYLAKFSTAEPVAEEAPVEEVTVGFIPMTLDNEYFITMVNAAQQEADKSGVKLLVQAGTSHGSAEEQLQIVETMITNKVDAICIVPSSSVGLMTALKKAEEAGIPVVNLDTGLDPDLVESSGLKPVPFIGTNNYDGAKLAGEYALEITGGTGEVAILTGIAGQQNAADRRNGFFDAVEGKLEVVAEASADWEVEKGYNAAQNIIQANPDIVLIFASNDNMALGAIRAAKEAGKDIKVIGYDAIGEALNSVKSGDMASTIAQFPAEMGIQGVQAALNLLGGGTMPEFTFTETRPITLENVDEFMTYLNQFK